MSKKGQTLTDSKVKSILRDNMKKSNLTIREILKRAGIDENRFHQYMSNKTRKIKFEWILAISNVIDLDLNLLKKAIEKEKNV